KKYSTPSGAAMNPNPLSVSRLIVPVVLAMRRVLLVAHICEVQWRYSYAVSHFAREIVQPIQAQVLMSDPCARYTSGRPCLEPMVACCRVGGDGARRSAGPMAPRDRRATSSTPTRSADAGLPRPRRCRTGHAPRRPLAR